ATARTRSGLDVRGQLGGGRDGQDGGRAVHHRRDVGHESSGERRHHFPLRVLAFGRAGCGGRRDRVAVRLRVPGRRAARPDDREVMRIKESAPTHWVGALRRGAYRSTRTLWSLVSLIHTVPTTKVIAATRIGYHKP